MEKIRKHVEENQFYKKLEDIAENSCFLDFDTFLIREMGFSYGSMEELESVRRKAMKVFRRRTDHYPFASLPTIRKWFGIGGFARPKREQVFQICLVLGVKTEDVSRYLTQGLGESSIRYSDHKEIIYIYGLENDLTCDVCQDMIGQYESQLKFRASSRPKREERQIFIEFKDKCKLPPDKFVGWMIENAEAFKGYSRKTMNCIYDYKKLVMKFMRKEARERLESLLAETDFNHWADKRKNSRKNRRELIKSYVNSHPNGQYYKISQNMRDNILELSKITYSGTNANSRLLAEVFSTSSPKEKRRGEITFRDIRSMTGKHLSDMLNVPVQRQRALKIMQAQITLSKQSREKPCPAWISRMSQEYSRSARELKTVEEAEKWLKEFGSEQQRRCVQIRRADVLPMAHYVAQHRYLQRIENNRQEYNAGIGRREFIEVANQMLQTCNMAEINEEFELDAVLLACFQPDEIYSYTDVLDVVEGWRC